MDRGARPLNNENEGEVVDLGVEKHEPPGPPPRASTAHAAAVFVTAVAAVIAIAAAVAFITVGWSGISRRVVIAVLMASIVLFMSGVAASVLTAARDTYVLPRKDPRN